MKETIFDLSAELPKIMKENGGQQFFRELNAARIPFFFAAAVKNTAKETEYYCEAITPGSMGLQLADDKFVDFLDIRNNGFVAVLSTDLTSEGAQALKMLDQTRKDGSFYDGALADFAKANGIEIVENDDLDDDLEDAHTLNSNADALIGSIMKYAISDRQNNPKEDVNMVTSGIQTTDLDIVWGDGGKPHIFGESFDKIHERHEGILKGSEAYLLEKDREVASGLKTVASAPEGGSDGEDV